MKNHQLYLALLAAECLFFSADAITYYVDINSTTPVSPYTNWTTAATSIQEGIDVASSNDTVSVAAGLYNESITLKSGVVLQGAGADITTIEGAGGSVVIATNLVGETVIKGFTIRGGSVPDTLVYFYGCGGGIYCAYSSLMIKECHIQANRAGRKGGGIYFKSATGLIANNRIEVNAVDPTSTFAGSKVEGGGGIHCNDSSPIITNNIIMGNIVKYDGGGILCDQFSSPLIANNTITKNSALNGSGGITAGYSTIISNNLISSNISGGEGGGGVSCWDYATVVGNIIIGNYSKGFGGGIMCWGENETVVNNVVAYNGASESGGGICSFYSSSSTRIANNLVYKNQSYRSGGGIYCDGGSAVIANCIIWGNGDDLDGCSAIYSCIEDGDSGEGNISSDPLFVYATNGNYRLLSGSPCIDAGTNGYVLTAADLDGNPRIVNGTVDMGPYEFQADGSAVNLHIQAILEKSPDLQAWTNSGMSAEWLLPADSSNEFYRVWLQL